MNALAPTNPVLASQLLRVEREIRSYTVEHAFAFSTDGELLFHKTDESRSLIAFDEEVKLLTGAILTHNHPGGRSFSEDDAMLAMRVRLAEMRVVTATTRFILRPPDQGWSWLVRRAFRAVVRMERHLLERELLDEIISGGRSPREADLVFHDLLWQRVSRRGLIHYRSEPW